MRSISRRAHPRSRGENVGELCKGHAVAGSSPLTRGKHWPLGPDENPAGLIPAHAGKTFQRQGRRLVSPAHPRSRGENSTGSERAPDAVGSSPLTRGKHRAIEDVITLTRLIPAHAGKTNEEWTSRQTRPAHPRSRGEN